MSVSEPNPNTALTRRFRRAAAINIAALLAAALGLGLEFGLHMTIGLGIFGAALALGFGAQIWFVLGFGRLGAAKS